MGGKEGRGVQVWWEGGKERAYAALQRGVSEGL